MAVQKGAMEPGKKYRGYGFINEYKEFCFEPEETGKNEGRIKPIASRDGVTLSETRDNLIIHAKIEKGDKVTLTRRVMELSNTLFSMIQKYDF